MATDSAELVATITESLSLRHQHKAQPSLKSSTSFLSTSSVHQPHAASSQNLMDIILSQHRPVDLSNVSNSFARRAGRDTDRTTVEDNPEYELPNAEEYSGWDESALRQIEIPAGPLTAGQSAHWESLSGSNFNAFEKVSPVLSPSPLEEGSFVDGQVFADGLGRDDDYSLLANSANEEFVEDLKPQTPMKADNGSKKPYPSPGLFFGAQSGDLTEMFPDDLQLKVSGLSASQNERKNLTDNHNNSLLHNEKEKSDPALSPLRPSSPLYFSVNNVELEPLSLLHLQRKFPKHKFPVDSMESSLHESGTYTMLDLSRNRQSQSSRQTSVALQREPEKLQEVELSRGSRNNSKSVINTQQAVSAKILTTDLSGTKKGVCSASGILSPSVCHSVFGHGGDRLLQSSRVGTDRLAGSGPKWSKETTNIIDNPTPQQFSTTPAENMSNINHDPVELLLPGRLVHLRNHENCLKLIPLRNTTNQVLTLSFSIEGARPTHFAVSQSSTSVAPGEICCLDLTYYGPTISSGVVGKLLVHWHGGQLSIPLYVGSNAEPSIPVGLTVIPKTIQFEGVELGDSYSLTVSLCHKSPTTYKVSLLALTPGESHAAFQVSQTTDIICPGSHEVFKVTFRPPRRKVYQAHLLIIVGPEVIKVPLVGYGGVAELKFSSLLNRNGCEEDVILNMGPHKAAILCARNVGTRSGLVTSLSVHDQPDGSRHHHLRLEPSTTVIPPGEAVDIQIVSASNSEAHAFPACAMLMWKDLVHEEGRRERSEVNPKTKCTRLLFSVSKETTRHSPATKAKIFDDNTTLAVHTNTQNLLLNGGLKTSSVAMDTADLCTRAIVPLSWTAYPRFVAIGAVISSSNTALRYLKLMGKARLPSLKHLSRQAASTFLLENKSDIDLSFCIQSDHEHLVVRPSQIVIKPQNDARIVVWAIAKPLTCQPHFHQESPGWLGVVTACCSNERVTIDVFVHGLVLDMLPNLQDLVRPLSEMSEERAPNKVSHLYFGRKFVDFGVCNVNQPLTQKIRLCNRSAVAMTVFVEPPGRPFSVRHKEFKIQPKSYVMLPVNFNSSHNGSFSADLCVYGLDQIAVAKLSAIAR